MTSRRYRDARSGASRRRDGQDEAHEAIALRGYRGGRDLACERTRHFHRMGLVRQNRACLHPPCAQRPLHGSRKARQVDFLPCWVLVRAAWLTSESCQIDRAVFFPEILRVRSDVLLGAVLRVRIRVALRVRRRVPQRAAPRGTRRGAPETDGGAMAGAVGRVIGGAARALTCYHLTRPHVIRHD
jgi:hypothetical protein